MKSFHNWRVETVDGICKLTLDVPGASQNVLSGEVLTELESVLDEIEHAQPRALLLCSGKTRGFIAGADVREFTRIESEQQARELLARAHRVFNRLEALPMPSVAVVNGHCLGGGLELALACKFRVGVAEHSVRIGLPEVLLGIHPGFGGIARLSECIGAPAALNLMLSGRTLDPKRAQRIGILDYAVAARQLQDCARYIAFRRAKKRGAFRRATQRLINVQPARALLAAVIRKKLRARVNPQHYPAPYQLLEVWQRHGGSRRALLRAEQDSVAQLLTTPAARNLVKVFFLRESLKKGGARAHASFAHVHVIGAGVMGGDIAAWCALRGLRATLHDKNAAALASATKRAHQLFRRNLRSRQLAQRALDRFQPDASGDGARHADTIIEAVVEDRDVKMQVFAQVQNIAREDALLATNTSSIPLESISDALQSPQRLVGLHFFNPVAKMQLIEIVRGEKTARDALSGASAFAARIGRLPLTVQSRPGFLVNRILLPYMLEAVQLLEEGTRAAHIDRAAEKFGMAMGPVVLADRVGLDICLHVAQILAESYGRAPPALLAQKVAAGKLGRKSGEGFYKWRRGKAQLRGGEPGARAAAAIEERLLLRFLNESVACVREGIVESADMLDAGMIFGAGFAPFRGGPMQYIAAHGAEKLQRRLNTLREEHGERFAADAGWGELGLGGGHGDGDDGES